MSFLDHTIPFVVVPKNLDAGRMSFRTPLCSPLACIGRQKGEEAYPPPPIPPATAMAAPPGAAADNVPAGAADDRSAVEPEEAGGIADILDSLLSDDDSEVLCVSRVPLSPHPPLFRGFVVEISRKRQGYHGHGVPHRLL